MRKELGNAAAVADHGIFQKRRCQAVLLYVPELNAPIGHDEEAELVQIISSFATENSNA